MMMERVMKRILIIEDNAESLYLLKFLLEKNGFETQAAKTGKKGVQHALKEKPDLILMDIQLPDISGKKATRLIRKSYTPEELPIIALTAYAMPGDRETFLSGGHSGYIQKPINPETFISEIENFLNQKDI
jgi:CheY-like chemotaxis protein